jgi:hypothetical protein
VTPADPPAKPILATRGLGPLDQNMDARVANLETHMEYVRADLADLKAA